MWLSRLVSLKKTEWRVLRVSDVWDGANSVTLLHCFRSFSRGHITLISLFYEDVFQAKVKYEWLNTMCADECWISADTKQKNGRTQPRIFHRNLSPGDSCRLNISWIYWCRNIYISILSPRAVSGMAIKYLLIFPDWAQISESGNLKSCAKWFTRQEKWIKN